MCGIGFYWAKESLDSVFVTRLMLSTERRGKDAFGFVLIDTENRDILELYKTRGSFSSNIDAVLDILSRYNGCKDKLVIWNNRAQPMTEVASIDEKDIQPLVSDKSVLVHNGVVANDEELKKEYFPDIIFKTNLDSEVTQKLLEKYDFDFKHVLSMVSGGSAYIVYDITSNVLYLVRDFKPLAHGYVCGKGYFGVSDVDELHRLLGEMNIMVWEDFWWGELEQFTIYKVNISEKGDIEKYRFEPYYISYLPKKDKNKVIVLASGGVDSTTAAYVAKKIEKKDVLLVHFNIGQKSQEREKEAVSLIAEDLKVPVKFIDLDFFKDFGASVLTDSNLEPPDAYREGLKSTVCWTPARNLIMLSILMGLAEAEGYSEIYNGFTLEEEGAYPDNSVSFFRAMNYVSDFGTLSRPKVKMVLGNLMKPEVVKLGSYLGVPYELAWSCDRGGEKQCGKCGACWLKKVAFIRSGIEDRTDYEFKGLVEDIRFTEKDIIKEDIESLVRRLRIDERDKERFLEEVGRKR